MQALRAKWFPSKRGTMGVVMAQDDSGELCFFMGVAEEFHEVIDINNIMHLGARLPELAGMMFFQEEDK